MEELAGSLQRELARAEHQVSSFFLSRRKIKEKRNYQCRQLFQLLLERNVLFYGMVHGSVHVRCR
jgi:hypothetical protein